MKKAQGLPMNTIVIAIIVVTVLVVLIMVFTGGMSSWTFGITSCTDKANHVCMPTETGCGTGYGQVRTAKCYDAEGKIDTSLVCCVRTGTGAGETGLQSCAEAGGERWSVCTGDNEEVVSGNFRDNPRDGTACCKTKEVTSHYCCPDSFEYIEADCILTTETCAGDNPNEYPVPG